MELLVLTAFALLEVGLVRRIMRRRRVNDAINQLGKLGECEACEAWRARWQLTAGR